LKFEISTELIFGIDKMITTAQILLSVIVGFSVLAVFMGIRAIVTPVESTDRVQQWILGADGGPPTLRELEMKASFYQRIIQPLLRGLLNQSGRLAPQKNVEALYQKLETAGFPGNLNVVDFLGLKILMGTLIGFLFAAVVYMVRTDSILIVGGTSLIFWVVGFMLPNAWLTTRVSARKKEVLKNMPDALDMMTVCVDAGLGLSGAIQRVAESWENALVDEFTRVLAEVKLGRTRLEALESMANRTDVDEMKNFVMALTLADKLGVSIAQVLHLQSKQMRVARRQRAEELARQASIKMLFPLVFLIFPAMFAVILGPAVPLLLETLTAF
jgi:tight adherence protein C